MPIKALADGAPMEQSVQSRTPVLLRFSVELPSVTRGGDGGSGGGWAGSDWHGPIRSDAIIGLRSMALHRDAQPSQPLGHSPIGFRLSRVPRTAA